MTHAEAVCWEGREETTANAEGRDATERDWVRAHAALSRLARERAAADAEEGRWLLVAWRSGTHVFLGFGSFSEYIERLLGYAPRATREKLRVAEALESLPASSRALERGELTWCAARELTRVAIAETEAAWLQAAHGKTTRELERLVSGREPGELPPLPTEPQAPRRHILRFEVAPETFATFREATRSLRRAAGGPLDDDALLLTMARQVLGAPPDERSSYRLTFQVCGACGKGSQMADGQPVPVAPEILAMAACDGEQLDLARPANENRPLAAPERAPAREPRVPEPEREPEPEPEPALVCKPPREPRTPEPPAPEPVVREPPREPRTPEPPAPEPPREPRAPEPPAPEPTRSTVGATPAPRTASAAIPPRVTHVGRARQAVPPAVRRAVLARDGHRCQVPGCTHTHFVDVHHLRPRAAGGRHTLDNLITLCTAHHRATHRGELVIERVGEALAFRHADGTPYGQPLRAASVEAHAKLFSALRHLGFREREVQRVLADLRADPALREAPLEPLLREALQRIRPART